MATAGILCLCACGGPRAGPAAPDPGPALTLDIGPRQLRFSWTPVIGATHYRLLEDPDGASGFTQLGSDLTATSFTKDISVHRFDWAGARYRVQACFGQACVSSSAVSTAGRSAEAVGYFKSSEFWANYLFGTAVALSADGQTLAVGAPWEDVARIGAVYVFARSGGRWTQQAHLRASNAGPGDLFGWFLALGADGDTLAVGAWGESSNATGVGGDGSNDLAPSSGAAYVFTRSGATWTEEAYLKASNAEAGDDFGFALALSGDGNTLAVGAPEEDGGTRGVGGDQGDNGATDAGAVYLFTRSGGTWTQQAYLKASNTDAGDAFGNALALSGDGNTLVVGAPGESGGLPGVGADQADNSAFQAGAAYVFTRSGSSWSQDAYLKPSNPGVSDRFAWSLALSASGDLLAVGAPWEDSAAPGVGGDQGDTTTNAGAVYLFARSGTAWSQEAYVKSAKPGFWHLFGRAVALDSAGDTLAVGADGEPGGGAGVGVGEGDVSAGGAGAVYLFGKAGGAWSERVYAKASNPDPLDGFGYAVALSADASALAVGAPNEASGSRGIDGQQADNSLPKAGAVYLY